MKKLIWLIISLLTIAILSLGSAPILVQAAGTAKFSLNPSASSVKVGDIFSLDVGLDASTQQVAGFDVFINFNPAYLKVVDNSGNIIDGTSSAAIQPGPLATQFSTRLANKIDNTQGHADFSYGIPVSGGTPVNTSGVIGTVRFKALQAAAGTALSFSSTFGRKTVAALAGADVTDPESLTRIITLIITSATTPTETSGGGGGGGGGGAPSPSPTPTPSPVVLADNLKSDVPLVLGTDAKTKSVVELTTAESDGTLHIESGTEMKTVDDKPLPTVTAKKVQPSQAPTSPNAVVLCYNFGPDGAKFVPDLTLTLKYSPADLKPGFDENNLYVAWWNGQDWENQGGKVDTKNHTITIKVRHFSLYSVMESAAAPSPSAASPAPAPSNPAPVTTIVPAPASPSVTAPAAPSPSVAPAPPQSTVVPPSVIPSGTPGGPTTGALNWPLAIGIAVVAVIVIAVITMQLLGKKKAK